jgi:hypothetical protein
MIDTSLPGAPADRSQRRIAYAEGEVGHNLLATYRR